MKVLIVVNVALIVASLTLAVISKNFSAVCGWVTALIWMYGAQFEKKN